MNIVEILNNKIPLLDDAVYFIPEGVNTLEEYKKVLQHSESINKLITLEPDKKDISTVDEFEEEFFEYDNTIENENDNKNILNEFSSIEDIIPGDIKEEVAKTSKKAKKTSEDKKTLEESDKEDKGSSSDGIKSDGIKFVTCDDIDLNEELDSLEELMVETIEVQPKEESENKNEQIEEDESPGDFSSLIGASLDVNVSSIIYGNDTLKYKPEENNYPTVKEIEDATKDDEYYFLNKIESLSKDDEDEISDMLSKINTINDLNNTEDEDDMIGMLSKMTLKDITDEDE